MLFKMLVLQRMNNLSDDRLEYQVRDRLSFMRFLGLDLAGVVPDAKTLWAFREELKENHLIDRLFARFDECLRALEVALEVALKSGQIIDATFVSMPKQRIHAKKTRLLKKMPFRLNGDGIPANWRKKTLMRAGRRRTTNRFMVTKITSIWIATPS